MRARLPSILRLVLPLAPIVLLVLLGGCQRAENVAAKERLSSPPAPDPVLEQAKEPLDAQGLEGSEVLRKRVNRMSFQEVAARLGSLKLKADGQLSFSRGDLKLSSSEKVEIVQSSLGDFSVHVVTGDGGEQRLAYINEIFFLKNNNGNWRTSRDPMGERNERREDSAGTWRSFYDLISHALVLEKTGSKRHAGRTAVRYVLSLPDQSAEARALAAKEPVATVETQADGGVVEEDPRVVNERLRSRLAKWRKNARPAGGKGELLVDEETGVLLYVKLDGKLVVGDGPTPAVLHVSLTQSVTEVGKDHVIPAPKDAIDEIVRKKWPVKPRELLEKEGLVAPLQPAAPKGQGGDEAQGT